MEEIYKALPSNTPKMYTAKNKKIICPHCNNDAFIKSYALLNTTIMTLLDLEWANKNAITLTCSDCGQVLWFLNLDKLSF